MDFPDTEVCGVTCDATTCLSVIYNIAGLESAFYLLFLSMSQCLCFYKTNHILFFEWSNSIDGAFF